MSPATRNLSVSLTGLRAKQSDVDSGIALVLAAAVTGAFGLLTVVIQRFKAENRKDHDTVMAMLRLMRRAQDRTEDKVDKVSDRLTEHITKH
jgi:hypothetical protein